MSSVVTPPRTGQASQVPPMPKPLGQVGGDTADIVVADHGLGFVPDRCLAEPLTYADTQLDPLVTEHRGEATDRMERIAFDRHVPLGVQDGDAALLTEVVGAGQTSQERSSVGHDPTPHRDDALTRHTGEERVHPPRLDPRVVIEEGDHRCRGTFGRDVAGWRRPVVDGQLQNPTMSPDFDQRRNHRPEIDRIPDEEHLDVSGHEFAQALDAAHKTPVGPPRHDHDREAKHRRWGSERLVHHGLGTGTDGHPSQSARYR